jgi:hypothetical protein
MSEIARLDRGIVRIAGEDAQKLLHDTLTANFRSPFDGRGKWWALLTPQGKVMFAGLVAERDDAYWFELPAADIAAFVKRMTLYRLRAKVEIEDLSETHALGWSADTPSTNSGFTYADGRAESLGTRVIAPISEAETWTGDAAAFEAARIRAGIIDVGVDVPQSDVFPHDIGMDQTGSIDFKKGCFVGQEVVSRMQHKSKLRKRPVLVHAEVELTPGDTVTSADKPVGEIVAAHGGHGVMVARLDRVKDALACTIGDVAVSLEVPGWASYDFDDSPSGETSDQVG